MNTPTLAIDPQHKYPHTKHRWTIADIAAQNESAGNYYFSRNTMKFFGDKRSFFGVRHIAGKIYVRRNKTSKAGMSSMIGSVREFNPATGSI